MENLTNKWTHRLFLIFEKFIVLGLVTALVQWTSGIEIEKALLITLFIDHCFEWSRMKLIVLDLARDNTKFVGYLADSLAATNKTAELIQERLNIHWRRMDSVTEIISRRGQGPDGKGEISTVCRLREDGDPGISQ